MDLLAARADVEQLSERKQSPLMLAAAAGHLEMCRKLLEAGHKPRVPLRWMLYTLCRFVMTNIDIEHGHLMIQIYQQKLYVFHIYYYMIY